MFEWNIAVYNTDEQVYLLKIISMVGIMLAASLASLGVLKSINNVNRIENEKKINGNKRLLLYLKDIDFTLTKICDELKYNSFYYEFVSKSLEGTYSMIKKDNEILNIVDTTNMHDLLLHLKNIPIYMNSSNLKNEERQKELFVHLANHKNKLENIIGNIRELNKLT